MNAHLPVLLDEVVDALAPRDGATYVDGTFGAGGYARALLEKADCRVLGIDRDPAAVERGRALAADFPGRLSVKEGKFGDMEAVLAEAELADIVFELGEERFARRVARAIVAARAEEPIRRTGQLAEIVRGALPPAKGGIDPATRTFQALRIAVNDELGELDCGLAAAERVLEPGGRLAVVSFHSLEDRRVKEFLRRRSEEAPRGSRHLPAAPAGRPASFRLLTRRAVQPGEAELRRNPRARSAKLRAAERTAAPAWGDAA